MRFPFLLHHGNCGTDTTYREPLDRFTVITVVPGWQFNPGNQAFFQQSDETGRTQSKHPASLGW